MSFSDLPRLSLQESKNQNSNYMEGMTPHSRESVGSKNSDNLNTSQRSFGSFCRHLTPIQNQNLINGRTSVGQFQKNNQERFSFNLDIDTGAYQQVSTAQNVSFDKFLQDNANFENGGENYTPNRFSNTSLSNFLPQNILNNNNPSFSNLNNNNLISNGINNNNLQNPFVNNPNSLGGRGSLLTEDGPAKENFSLFTGGSVQPGVFGHGISPFPDIDAVPNSNFNLLFSQNNHMNVVPNRNTIMKEPGNPNLYTISGGGNNSIGASGGLRSNGGSLANRNSSVQMSRISRGGASDTNRMSFETFNFEPIDPNQVSFNSSARKSDSLHQDGQENKREEDQLAQLQQLEGCYCQQSRCLKLYCECFANSQMCQPYCQCLDCHNLQQFAQQRENAIKTTLVKNPSAFLSKIEVLGNILGDHEIGGADGSAEEDEAVISDAHNAMLGYQKGCNCKKTFCRQQYCECYNAGVQCSYLCQCEGCLNCNDDPKHNHVNDNLYQDMRLEEMEEEKRGTNQQKCRKLSDIEQQVNLAPNGAQRKYSQRIANQKDHFDVSLKPNTMFAQIKNQNIYGMEQTSQNGSIYSNSTNSLFQNNGFQNFGTSNIDQSEFNINNYSFNLNQNTNMGNQNNFSNENFFLLSSQRQVQERFN